MKSETISDIVREMRLHTRCSAADAFYDIVAWTKLCDRIEAAAKATIYTDNSETLRNALAENDHLRAALKPVLEFSLQNLQSNPMQTIREAQRIYKEGANNGKEQ